VKVCKDTIILQGSSLMSCQNVSNTSDISEVWSIQDGACCEGNGNTKLCITGT